MRLQVWRPLAGPVEDSPLAMADVTTVDQNDLLTSLLHFPGRTGEVYSVAHNPAHRCAHSVDNEVSGQAGSLQAPGRRAAASMLL